MAIRFDTSFRRATNGPVIFFSDASSQTAFAEEINGAIFSGLSFYSYRLPGDMMITFGSSEGFVEGLGTPGFVIGRFAPECPVLTIPYKGCKTTLVAGSEYDMPAVSTSEEDYINEVKYFKEALETHPKGKIVAARAAVSEGSLDLAEVFFDFSNRFPDAYIFCFSTPATGCWIGASPELLLEGSQGWLRTMALAGTRSVGSPGDWDPKNLQEQNIVTDFIMDTFRDAGLQPMAAETFTKPSGSIEHICTPVAAPLPNAGFNLESLLRDLSPTPALSGFPKDFALHEIYKTEKFQRGCYGGFCGPYHSDSDFSFNVVLRCMSVAQQRFCRYAGGGITLLSNPRDEWAETEAKLSNI